MKRLFALLIAGLCVLPLLAADPAYSFTYQAVLLDETGHPIRKDGVVQRNQVVTLRLYDNATEGHLLWGRTFNVYTDADGLFNLEVNDDGSPVDASENPLCGTLEEVFTEGKAGGVYIGLTVKGSAGEIVPRQRLFAVPFAAVANDVRKITKDIAVGGNITLGDANSGVVITKSGIRQNGSALAITAQTLTSQGEINAGGAVNANAGLNVSGGKATFKVNVEIDRSATLAKGGEEILPVPVGGIIMWSQENSPEGGAWSNCRSEHWAICNGQKVNNMTTPNLRGRFVVGANNSTTGRDSTLSQYNLADKNGEERHTLTTSEMPSHRHSYSFTGADLKASWDGDNYFYDRSREYPNNKNTEYTNYEGGGDSHENRPPYYALYYIMRIK